MPKSRIDGVSGFARTPISRRTALRGVAAGGLAFLVPSLAACGGDSAARNASSSGKISGGIGYNVSTKFDPALSTDVPTQAVNNHIHESLVTLSPVDRTLSNGLATEMPESSGTTITVKIREATFHDGSKVTADDVVFSFERIKDPALNSNFAKYLTFISAVKAVDATTVEFTLQYPTSLFANRLALVKIVPKAAFAAGPDAFEAKPIGCGPYKFTEFQQNDHVSVEAFSAYTGSRKGGPQALTLRLMTDGSSRVAAMSGKQVDMIDDVPYQDAANLSKVSGIDTETVLSNMSTTLILNTGKKPFNDKRVRQALLYSIDRDAISKDVFLGNCESATSVLPSAHPDYAKPSTVYTYDPDKAKSLLAEAGYPNGLDITLQVNANTLVAPQGPIVQSSAEKAGFRITLKQGQTAALFKNVVAGDFEAFITPADASVLGYDADTLLRYLFSGNLTKEWMRWEGAEANQVTDLLDQASKNTDRAAQKALWAQAQDIIAAEVPAYPVLFKKQATAWSKDTLGKYKPLPAPGVYVAGLANA